MSKNDHPVLGYKEDYIVIDLEKLSGFVTNNDHSAINQCYTHPLFFHLTDNLNLVYVPIKRNGINRLIVSNPSPQKNFEVDRDKIDQNVFKHRKLVAIDIALFVKEVINLERLRPSPKSNIAFRNRENGLALYQDEFIEWEEKYRSLIWKCIKMHRSNLEHKLAILEGCISYLNHSIEAYNQLYDFIEELKVYKRDILKLNYNPKTSTDPFPSIFEDGAFQVFELWIKKSKDNQDKKLSFIFQKLKEEGKLRNTTFKDLSKWAFENGYIDEENFNKLLEQGSFHSPTKIFTKGRLTLYNLLTVN